MSARPAIAVVLSLLVAACGSGGAGVQTVSSRPAVPMKAAVRTPSQAVPAPRFQMIPGLEGVIGASTAELVSRFGPARLDVFEGEARKLQFAGTACVLDVYLYPAAPGAQPAASYVEARRASDGQDVDRAACVAALRRK